MCMPRISRPIAYGAVGFLVLLLGLQQIASMALLAPYASPLALPRLLPESLGVAMYGAFDRAPISARLVAPLRVTLARRLVASGHTAEARDVVERLPPGVDRYDLEGMLAADRGALLVAADDFVEAGDDQHLASVLDTIVKTDLIHAIALQERLVARFSSSPIPAPGLADAYWRLGILQATLGYVGKPEQRGPANIAALASYQQAVDLAPFSARYLLALGNQASNSGEPALAMATFRRVLELDPQSKDAPAAIKRLGGTIPSGASASPTP